jgi:hypothetical protein
MATLPEIDRQLELLLESGTPPEAPAWADLLDQRAEILAHLPACPQTLRALELSLLSGARLMAALRAERERDLRDLEEARQTQCVHAGYASETPGALRQWSA